MIISFSQFFLSCFPRIVIPLFLINIVYSIINYIWSENRACNYKNRNSGIFSLKSQISWDCKWIVSDRVREREKENHRISKWKRVHFFPHAILFIWFAFGSIRLLDLDALWKNFNFYLCFYSTYHHPKKEKYIYILYMNDQQPGLWTTWSFIKNSCCASELNIRLQAKNKTQQHKHTHSHSKANIFFRFCSCSDNTEYTDFQSLLSYNAFLFKIFSFDFSVSVRISIFRLQTHNFTQTKNQNAHGWTWT